MALNLFSELPTTEGSQSSYSNDDKSPNHLCVFGYSCKLFRDDDQAFFIDRGDHLIPWMNNSDNMIDRYDGRGHLFDLRPYDADSNRYEPLTEDEQRIEALCDEERYLELHTDLFEKAVHDEEELKRLNMELSADSKKYSSVAFNYDESYDPSEPTEEDQDRTDDPNLKSGGVPFVLPAELEKYIKPNSIALPKTTKENAIIIKTAMFVAKQGQQMEIIIKMKQMNNSQFDFLSFDHDLNPYYKLMVKLLKEKKYYPPKDEEPRERVNSKSFSDNDSDDEGYLHPLLQSRQPIPNPSNQQHASQTTVSSTIENTFVPDTTHSSYAKLMSNLKKQKDEDEQRFEQERQEQEKQQQQEEDRLAVNNDKNNTPNQNNSEEEQMYSYYDEMGVLRTISHSDLQRYYAEQGITPEHAQFYIGDENENNVSSDFTREPANTGTEDDNQPSEVTPDDVVQGCELPPSLGASESKADDDLNNDEKKSDSVDLTDAKEFSEIVENSDDMQVEEINENEIMKNDICSAEKVPPKDVKVIIDKLAEYVARNGPDFEEAVKRKNDPSFKFLLSSSEWHVYYNMKKMEEIQKVWASGNSGGGDGKDGKRTDDATDFISGSNSLKISLKKHRRGDTTGKEISQNEAFNPENQIDSGEESDSVTMKDAMLESSFDPTNENAASAITTPTKRTNPLTQKITNIDDLSPEAKARLLEDRIKNKLALAAKAKLAETSKEKQMQSERKRKAARFISLLKAKGISIPEESAASPVDVLASLKEHHSDLLRFNPITGSPLRDNESSANDENSSVASSSRQQRQHRHRKKKSFDPYDVSRISDSEGTNSSSARVNKTIINNHHSSTFSRSRSKSSESNSSSSSSRSISSSSSLSLPERYRDDANTESDKKNSRKKTSKKKHHNGDRISSSSHHSRRRDSSNNKKSSLHNEHNRKSSRDIISNSKTSSSRRSSSSRRKGKKHHHHHRHSSSSSTVRSSKKKVSKHHRSKQRRRQQHKSSTISSTTTHHNRDDNDKLNSSTTSEDDSDNDSIKSDVDDDNDRTKGNYERKRRYSSSSDDDDDFSSDRSVKDSHRRHKQRRRRHHNDSTTSPSSLKARSSNLTSSSHSSLHQSSSHHSGKGVKSFNSKSPSPTSDYNYHRQEENDVIISSSFLNDSNNKTIDTNTTKSSSPSSVKKTHNNCDNHNITHHVDNNKKVNNNNDGNVINRKKLLSKIKSLRSSISNSSKNLMTKSKGGSDSNTDLSAISDTLLLSSRNLTRKVKGSGEKGGGDTRKVVISSLDIEDD